MPNLSERSDGNYVSSMIPLSDDKPSGPRGHQTWGIVASLIKQQEDVLLNESQPIETAGNSQVVESHAPVNTYGDIITEDTLGTTDDFTLQTEHDVFADFIGEDIDP